MRRHHGRQVIIKSHIDTFENGRGRTKHLTLDEYLKRKIKMLTDDFCIILTWEEKEHLRELKTERDIDRAARKIIKDHFGE